MTTIGGTPREAKPIILRQLCERFHRPFDHMEVYKLQLELGNRNDILTQDEIATLLPRSDFISVVSKASHNARAKYEFRDDCRLPEQVSIAVGPRSCAKCGRDIHRGERIFDPRARSRSTSKRRAYCRDCGLVELRGIYLALEGRPQPTRKGDPDP